MCEICGKMFCSAAQLKTHVAGVHGDLRKFVCQDCGKSSKTYQTHYRHRRCVHNDLAARDREKGAEESPAVCPYCGKVFPTAYKLKIHEDNMHRTGVYRCLKCAVTFGSQRESRQHYARVHAVQNYRNRKKARDLSGSAEAIHQHL